MRRRMPAAAVGDAEVLSSGMRIPYVNRKEPAAAEDLVRLRELSELRSRSRSIDKPLGLAEGVRAED